jgi:hypothetical protein
MQVTPLTLTDWYKRAVENLGDCGENLGDTDKWCSERSMADEHAAP